MADEPDLARPFNTFNFEIVLHIGSSQDEVCQASFSECDGLEMSIEPKTIREGGNNGRQIHLMGPVSYGQLSLKRGMTPNMGLWDWFEQVQTERSVRARGEVIVKSADRSKEVMRFALTGCLPVKLRAPGLSAKDGALAIEEMQVAYETFCRIKVS